MSNFECEKESEVVRALGSGELGGALLAHIGTCRVCADVVSVTRFLQAKAAHLNQLDPPDSSVVWRRAQLKSRREALSRATLPIQLVRGFAIFVAVAALCWLMFSNEKLVAWILPVRDFHFLNANPLDISWHVAWI